MAESCAAVGPVPESVWAAPVECGSHPGQSLSIGLRLVGVDKSGDSTHDVVQRSREIVSSNHGAPPWADGLSVPH